LGPYTYPPYCFTLAPKFGLKRSPKTPYQSFHTAYTTHQRVFVYIQRELSSITYLHLHLLFLSYLIASLIIIIHNYLFIFLYFFPTPSPSLDSNPNTSIVHVLPSPESMSRQAHYHRPRAHNYCVASYMPTTCMLSLSLSLNLLGMTSIRYRSVVVA